MTLFGLTMEQVLACDGMGVQFGSMGFLSCREAAFLNNRINRTPIKLGAGYARVGRLRILQPKEK